jgi:predicted transcriptional regulator
METRHTIPAREMERMMKLQDVILKAMARKITWIDAAEIAAGASRWRSR